MKHRSMLPLFVKLEKSAPAANTLGIAHLVDPSFHIFPEEDSHLMVQSADAFVINDHQPVSLYANSS